MATASWIGGPVLRVLRLAHGYDQETIARKANLDRSSVSRIENNKRRPSASALTAWLNTCPVPVIGKHLEIDLAELISSQHDWIRANLIVIEEQAIRADWIRRAIHALQLPPTAEVHFAAETQYGARILESLLWLSFRAAQRHGIALPPIGHLQIDHSQDALSHYAWLLRMWDELTRIPVIPASQQQPKDPMLDQLMAIWTTLPDSARVVCADLANSLKKHWPK